ncbi:MAG: hypothetical protein ACLFRP_02790 [Puniceicoccaceae bacterium]
MSLVAATLLAGAGLLAAGSLLWAYPPAFQRAFRAFPRSDAATLVLLTLATALVLFHVSRLGEADFGKYRHLLFGFFLALSIGAWFRVPDFLGIRALSVLGLLLANVFLHAAYLEPPATRLLLVGLTYLLIPACLYLAAAPYRFRDAAETLDRSPRLRRISGAAGAGLGVLLCLAAFTY